MLSVENQIQKTKIQNAEIAEETEKIRGTASASSDRMGSQARFQSNALGDRLARIKPGTGATDQPHRLAPMSTPPGFPNDSDGDALRRLIAIGASLDRPMNVDFQIATQTEESAHEIAAACTRLGYHTRADRDEGRPQWTVTCTTRMILNYHTVIAFQKELAQIAKPLGGWPDGWGTFGNAPTIVPTYPLQ